MSNFFSKFFSKKKELDVDKLRLSAELSVQYALFDKYLIGLAVSEQKVDILRPYLLLINEIDCKRRIPLSQEIENLNKLIVAYQKIFGDNFNIKFQNNCSDILNMQIEPFILFPLVQNAIRYGYNSLEKYPVRIKLNVIGGKVKLEVSNRVNHHIENQKNTSLISNFESRLQLYYPDQHLLLISSNSMLFKATLLLE